MPSETQQTKKKVNNLQERNERLEVTCIRLFENDMQLFREIPDLKRTLSPTVRKFIRGWLRSNGFSEDQMRQQRRDLIRERRDIDARILTMDQQIDVNFQKMLKAAKERVEDAEGDRQVHLLDFHLAKELWVSRRGPLARRAQLGGKELNTEAWVESRAKDYMEVPGYKRPIDEIVKSIEQFILEEEDEWELEEKQKFEKGVQGRKK